MTELLYQTDAYLKEAPARIEEIGEDRIILDRTIFHPRGGGLVSDVGWLCSEDIAIRVLEVRWENGVPVHVVEETPFIKGQRIMCILDWPKRYRMMQFHTAAHVLAALLYERGARITGNQITPEKARFDFNLPEGGRTLVEEAIQRANRYFGKNIPVEVLFISREEFLKHPDYVKLKHAAPPNVDPIRLIKIGDIDIQADGGPHVANLREVPKIKLLKFQNKGKENKRVYLGFDDGSL